MDDIENFHSRLHVQDVRLECIESIVKDSNTSDMTAGDSHEPRIDKVCQVKNHIGTLKNAWALSEGAVWFANGLEQESLADFEENWLSCEDQVLEKNLMNKERKEAENVKNDIEEIEEELENHTEDIQTADEAIKQQKLQIQNKLTVIREKMEKLKKLQERKQLLESQKRQHPSGCATANYKEHLAEKLEQTAGALKQCTAAVDSLNEHTSLLEAERDSCHKTLIKLEEKKSSSKEKMLKSREKQRMNFMLNLVTSCGLRVVNIAENWLEIEITDIYDDSSCEDLSTLLLTVHFGEGDEIEDVTANCSTSFINDLINQLRLTHELKLFNLEVQKRFHDHVKLLKEMKVLQKRFAIDWNEEEQVVRLMLGKAGQIVCSLKIQNGYPTNGDVTVQEIHGADPAVLFQDSLVTKELRTLTSWIEYLDIKYSSL